MRYDARMRVAKVAKEQHLPDKHDPIKYENGFGQNTRVDQKTSRINENK